MPNINKKTIFAIVKIFFVVAVIAVAFWLGGKVGESQAFKSVILKYGYVGVFLASVISGVNVVVPIPIISFLPLFIEAGLSYWWTIVFISLGVSLGDSVGYLLGRAGREVATTLKQGHVDKLEKLREKHKLLPMVILFFFAALIPFPNEIIVIPLAVIGYKFKQMLPWIIVGNFFFNAASAYGFLNLFDLFR